MGVQWGFWGWEKGILQFASACFAWAERMQIEVKEIPSWSNGRAKGGNNPVKRQQDGIFSYLCKDFLVCNKILSYVSE